MRGSRLFHTLRLFMIPTGAKRAEYLKKKKIFRSIGENCVIMDRKIPLYAKLISLGDNVTLASGVTLVTHDITHQVINRSPELLFGGKELEEQLGCIEIGSNVFVGANVTLLYDVRIGENSIIGAGSVVTKDIPAGSVAVGVPARVICSLEEYVARRQKEGNSSAKEAGREGISQALAEECWNSFLQKRQ